MKYKSIKTLISVCLCLVLTVGLFPTVTFAASAPVAINTTNFPDANFRAYVKANFDTDHNNSLSQSEMDAVIAITSDYFENLKGVEFFTNLERLDVECGGTESYTLDLSANTNLSWLCAQECYFDSVIFSNCSMLQTLYIDNNKIKSNSFVNLTELTRLYINCRDDSVVLGTIDFSHNTKLKQLYCDHCGLSSLNLSALTDLEELGCFDNNLSSLNLSNNTKLVSVRADHNRLTSIIIGQNNTSLRTLYCENNKLADLDLRYATALRNLYCQNNLLTSLALSQNTALVNLYCSNNAIKSLDLSNNPLVTRLDCSNNALLFVEHSNPSAFESFAAGNQTRVFDFSESLDLSGGSASFDVTKVSDLVGGTLDGTVFTVDAGAAQASYTYNYTATHKAYVTLKNGVEINETNFGGTTFRIYIGSSNVDKNSDGFLSDEEADAVTTISVSNAFGFGELKGIEFFKNLETLSLTSCGVTNPDLSQNTKLKSLKFSTNNGITSLDLSNNVALQSLELSYCLNLSSLNLSNNIALESLKFSSCGVEELDISGNTSIREVHVSNGKLTSIDVSGCTSLETLVATNNLLTSVNLVGCGALKSINVSKNNLTEVDLTGLSNLELFWCAENRLESVDLSPCSKLYTVDVTDNLLTELETGTLPLLLTLKCSDNAITSLDISANTRLNALECDNNAFLWLDASSLNISGHWSTSGQSRAVDFTTETVDLSDGREGFVPSNVKNMVGGTLDGSVLTIDDDATEVTYTYSVTRGTTFSVNVTLTRMPIEINAENFPGVDFRSIIESNYDTDDDGYLSSAEANAVTEIKLISGRPLFFGNFVGIEYFKNLETLSCPNMGLTVLDLSKNKKLKNLVCYRNNLTELDLTGNPLIERVECYYNDLTSIDVSGCTELEFLLANNNALTEINTSGCTSLKNLGLCVNQFTELDLSGLSALQIFDCSDNQLSELDLTELTALSILHCNDNNLTELDVGGMTTIRQIYCQNNAITELDTAALNKLSVLDCSNNKLINLNLHPEAILAGGLTDMTGQAETVVFDGVTREVDLAALSADFDGSRVTNLVGGTLDGNVLTVDEGVDTVTYDYDTGYRHCPTISLTLTVEENGDINGDSAFDVLDVTILERALNGHITLKGRDLQFYDMNFDGALTAEDYSAIVDKVLAV